jgi:site-specific recombinase XerD
VENEIIQFKAFLQRRYPGRSTAKHYMSDLAIFKQFVGDIPPKQVAVKTIDWFVQAQSDEGLKPATINRRLSTIASFFDYLIVEHEDDNWQNPVHHQRHSIRMGDHLPRDVSDGTATTLLAAIDDKRDAAMIWLMVGAGLRIGEVVQLQLEDLDAAGTTHMARLRVRGKGQKERVVWLTHDVLKHVQAWLETRPPAKCNAFFLNQHGQPLSVAGVQFRLKQHCQTAGVQLTAHQLRHTFARRLVENGMPVESLAKLLGHRQLKTTQRYIDGADPALRSDFFQAMERVSQLTATGNGDNNPVPGIMAPTPSSSVQEEEGPQTTLLLDQLSHLIDDLPLCLQSRLREHTLRRAARWTAHRRKPQLNHHLGTLGRMCRWLVQNRAWHQLDHLQRADLVAYVHHRQEVGVKPRSIGTELTVFRMFWRDLLAEERVTNGAILQVKAPAAEELLPRYLTLIEYQRLVQVVQAETAQDRPKDRFNRAWFYLLAHAGLRSSEVRNVRLEDCDLVSRRLRVQAGKGNRDRVIPMTRQLAEVLQAYLLVREPATSNHLLIYKQAAVKAHLIPDRLRRWGTKAHIEPMTPHRLRHTLATMLINQGMPIVSLQKLLGHQDINKTLIYARVHDETVKEQFATAMNQIERIPADDWPIRLAELEATTVKHLTDSV